MRTQQEVAAEHFRAAAAHQSQGRLDDAISHCRKAVEIKPDFARAWVALGELLSRAGAAEQGIAAAARSIQLNPTDAAAHFALAGLLHQRRRLGEAAHVYDRATRLDPRNAVGWNNYGNLCSLMHEPAKAEHCFRSALALDPTMAESYSNLGLSLGKRGRVDDAIECFSRALKLKPDAAAMHSNLLLACNSRSRADENLLDEHVEWGRRHAAALYPPPAMRRTVDRLTARRLRIGYVSPDFRRHPIAYFSQPFLRGHDRARFEIYCYSDARRADDMTRALSAAADSWRDTAALADEQLARTITQDRIDILVDLCGHMGNHRLLVFARRPAPVQVTYLGYPNTTGLATIDFRITDVISDPPGMTEAHYTETLVRLPRCFLCYSPPAAAPLPREQDADPSPQVTFGCLSNFSKVTHEAIEVWSRILHAAPQSKILLKADGLSDEQTRADTWAQFRYHGVDPSRVQLIGRTPSFRDHLGTYHYIDVALDTFPYNGTTTTCEALWMGVPVVTLAGRSHRSRVGASLLTNLDLAELSGTSLDQYVTTAVALANSAQRRRSITADLRERMSASPIMNAAAFVRDLESALLQIWQASCGTNAASI
jgi:predicted O-linked N-acetylglucosamine transferase (SPINDLY family)